MHNSSVKLGHFFNRLYKDATTLSFLGATYGRDAQKGARRFSLCHKEGRQGVENGAGLYGGAAGGAPNPYFLTGKMVGMMRVLRMLNN